MIQKPGTGVNFGWGQTQERSWAMRWTGRLSYSQAHPVLDLYRTQNFGKIEQRRNQKHIMRVLDTAAVPTDQQIEESMPTLTCWVCAWMCSYKKMRFNGWTQTIFSTLQCRWAILTVSDGAYLWMLLHPATNGMELWVWILAQTLRLCFRRRHTVTYRHILKYIAKITIAMIIITTIASAFPSTPSWWGSPWRGSPGRRSPPVRGPSLRRGSTPVRQDPKLGPLQCKESLDANYKILEHTRTIQEICTVGDPERFAHMS